MAQTLLSCPGLVSSSFTTIRGIKTVRYQSVLASGVVFSFALGCVVGNRAVAQGAHEWGSLSITEFVAEAERLLTAVQGDVGLGRE